MRRQVRAAMIFNGARDIDEIDEETFNEICIMYGEGMLGNRAIFNALAPITAGVFNYLRTPSSPSYTAEKIFPWITEYDHPELEDQADNSLLLFMSQAPGFSMERFNVG